MAPLLQIEDLHTEIRLRSATVYALDGVSLTVEAGECLGIVGESGSGKTMTALSIMQLLPPGGHITSGQIVLGGQVISSLNDDDMRHVRGNEVGMIFQDPMTSLNPTMTIGDQIAETVRLHRGADKQTALARAVEVLGLVGMPRPAERVKNYPHHLSGGMRQRVMIAMALSLEPELLIADEPTSALDVTLEAQILALLRSIQASRNLTILFVTHDLNVVAQICDRVVVMYAGEIVEQGGVLDVFEHPQHPYSEALLQAVPTRRNRGRTLATIPGQVPSLLREVRGCRFADRCGYTKQCCRTESPPVVASGASQAVRCHMRGPATLWESQEEKAQT